MKNRLIAQGYDYYWNGAVRELTKTGTRAYQAKLTIEENYYVTLKLDENGALLWKQCKCSCLRSPCYKHIAAVYAALVQQNSFKE